MLENFRAQKIIWDRANKKIFEKIEANSGDSNGRKLVVQVINQEATENLLGTTLSLGWKSRNGAKGLDAFNAVDASKGIFEIYYTTEMLSNIGNIEASLILIDSTGRIESSTFTISVRPSTVDDESVESENSFTTLTEALVKVNDFDAQLAQKIGGGVKAEPEDLSDTTLGLITGTGGPINLLSIPQDNSVTDEKVSPDSNIVVKKAGKNKINLDGFTDGFYINFNTGEPVPLEGYGYTTYLPVIPNTQYTLSNQSAWEAIEQLAFYSDKNTSNFISGLSNAGASNYVTFTTPTNAKYIRSTLRSPIKDKYQLEIGSTVTDLEPFKSLVSKEDLPKFGNEPTILTVSKTGGDFANIRAALNAIVDASADNRYIIQLHEGLYNILEEYSSAEISDASFIGLQIPNYVDLVGVGDKDKIVIELTLDTVIFDSATRGRVSTLAKKGNGDIRNVTVKCTNGRYAVHDDYNFSPLKRNVEDCSFQKFGSGLEQAYGGGTFSGDEFEFERCTFYTDGTGIPFSFHNNVNFSKPSKIKLKSNAFENKAGLAAIRFGSMGSGQKDIIEMVGNRLKGQVKLFEEQSNGVGIDFQLKGYANDIVPIAITHTHPTQQVVYDLVGQTKKMYNGHTSVITKGTVLRQNSWGSAVAPLGSADAIFYYGIAMENIPVGGSGYVRIGGYLPISETGLTLVLGDKVGIVNGVLAKVTGENYIGYVTINNFIKLK